MARPRLAVPQHPRRRSRRRLCLRQRQHRQAQLRSHAAFWTCQGFSAAASRRPQVRGLGPLHAQSHRRAQRRWLSRATRSNTTTSRPDRQLCPTETPRQPRKTVAGRERTMRTTDGRYEPVRRRTLPRTRARCRRTGMSTVTGRTERRRSCRHRGRRSLTLLVRAERGR